MVEEKHTPLFEWHKAHGGKMVEYAGWSMPVLYEGLMEEHQAVRGKAGMFDVSHMGEVRVHGKQALNFIQHLLTNDFSSMKDGEILYTFMCYPEGGVVDDLLVYRFKEDEYLLVINAGNVSKDLDWIQKQAESFDVTIKDESDDTGELAIQGPLAEVITQKLTTIDLSDIKFFHFKDNVTIAGVNCLISRTGYTGEDGFEIYTRWDDLEQIWKALMEAGQGEGIQAAGLGCRDTLRFEAGLPLYGHEIDQDISPLEAGFGFFVNLKKENFIGKEVLMQQKQEGTPRKLVGFELIGRGIPRSGYDVMLKDEKIGVVTTGYLSPTLNKNVGLALVHRKAIGDAKEIQVQIRKKRVDAKLIPKPFYRKNTKSRE